jgi:hypothetical protein
MELQRETIDFQAMAAISIENGRPVNKTINLRYTS